MNTVRLAVDLIFDLGLVINAVIYFPQIIKIIRTKEARDLSLMTFIGIALLQLSFALHGYFHQDRELTIGMLAAFLVSCWLVFLMIRYRKA